MRCILATHGVNFFIFTGEYRIILYIEIKCPLRRVARVKSRAPASCGTMPSESFLRIVPFRPASAGDLIVSWLPRKESAVVASSPPSPCTPAAEPLHIDQLRQRRWLRWMNCVVRQEGLIPGAGSQDPQLPARSPPAVRRPMHSVRTRPQGRAYPASRRSRDPRTLHQDLHGASRPPVRPSSCWKRWARRRLRQDPAPQPSGQTAHAVDRPVLQRRMPLNDISAGNRQQPPGQPVMKGKQGHQTRINCKRDKKRGAVMTFEPRLTAGFDRTNG
jgi:hypothetical protein